MPSVAAVRLHNIISVTQGDTYLGVRSVTISADAGKLMPILDEGKLYPAGMENVGTPELPVTTQVTFETDASAMLALLGQAKANLVIVLKKVAGGGNQTITIANHKFNRISQAQSLQDFGKPTISGGAHSSDGDALPIAVT